jgi:hypothetical protein
MGSDLRRGFIGVSTILLCLALAGCVTPQELAKQGSLL